MNNKKQTELFTFLYFFFSPLDFIFFFDWLWDAPFLGDRWNWKRRWL